VCVLQPAEVAPQEIRPLKRTEYDRLVALGAFGDDRVELIHGNLVTMAPNDPEHANPIDVLNALLTVGLRGRARVRVQQPIVAADESEPEPDVTIVPNGRYAQQHPSKAHLVIEVAASSLKKDRDVKAPLYAASGFREYWIVDVAARSLEVFRDPVGNAYRTVATYEQGTGVHPLDFPDIEVTVDALFE
jgi:Uma2 family endonuclease